MTKTYLPCLLWQVLSHRDHWSIGVYVTFWLHSLEKDDPRLNWTKDHSIDNNYYNSWLGLYSWGFPFCLLPLTLLLWDDLKAWRRYEGTNFRKYSEFVYSSPGSSYPHLSNYCVAYSLVLSLAPHILYAVDTTMCHRDPTLKRGPIAPASGNTVSKQSSAVSPSGIA